jgi:hypothetical protein
MFQVFETGDPLKAFTMEYATQDNHQTTVGYRQISRENRAPVSLVFAQSGKTGSRRRNQKPAALYD